MVRLQQQPGERDQVTQRIRELGKTVRVEVQATPKAHAQEMMVVVAGMGRQKMAETEQADRQPRGGGWMGWEWIFSYLLR